MTVADPAMPAAPQPRPFRLTMLLPTLLVDGVAPIGIFKGLELLGVSPVWALCAGCAPPVLNNLSLWIQARRLDPVGFLIMGSLVSGAVGSLVAGDIAARIVADCLLASAWGVAFLGSLLLARPAIFYLIRSLVAGDDPVRTEAWNGLWTYARFRSAMRAITATWGVVYLAQMLIEVGLALRLKADAVLTIAPVISTAATFGLVLFTRLAMLATRRRLERLNRLTWPL